MKQLPDYLSNPPPSSLPRSHPEILPAQPDQPPVLIGYSTIAYQLPEGNSPEAIRARIPLLKEITERCYMRMARDLWDCFQRKLYVGYGYSNFDDYVATEVGISRDRSYKLRRIFAVLVLKCDIPTREVESADRSRVEMILSIVNRENAKDWLAAAKTLPYKELKNKVVQETTRRNGPPPSVTKADKPETTTPVRLACESPRAPESFGTEEFIQRTFRLPVDGDTLLTESLAVAQRVTGSHSDTFNLICILQQFHAHNLTVEGKDDARRGYFQRWMEEIYGGHFLHIKNDEAWAVLTDAVEKHPHLFGTSEREASNGSDRHGNDDGDPRDLGDPEDLRHPGRQEEEEGEEDEANAANA